MTSSLIWPAEAEEIRKRVPESAWQMLKEFDERAAAYRSVNRPTVREKKLWVRRQKKRRSVVSTYLEVIFTVPEDWGEKMNGFSFQYHEPFHIPSGGVIHFEDEVHWSLRREKATLREQTRDSILFPRTTTLIDLARPTDSPFSPAVRRSPDQTGYL